MLCKTFIFGVEDDSTGLHRIAAKPDSSLDNSLKSDMEHIIVHRDDTMYYITPWLLRLESGELIVTAREAHWRRRDLISHIDPTARGILLRSDDGGRSWGEKTIIDDQTFRFSQTEDVPVTSVVAWIGAEMEFAVSQACNVQAMGSKTGRPRLVIVFRTFWPGWISVICLENRRDWSLGPMEPISPCVYRRNASRYAVRSVRHVAIAKSEYLRWPPRDVRRGALHTL